MSANPQAVSLTPGKRVLFLTKDPGLIRKQLTEDLDLRMEDLSVDDLLDDINTDAMTPAWVCFDYLPEEIAKNAYAGLIIAGERLIGERELIDGGFEVIVSGQRKGVGSSRETAVQAEKFCGIRIAIAASFAPIHARNNINQGVLMGDHHMLTRLQRGEALPYEEFTQGLDPVTSEIVYSGGLFAFNKRLAANAVDLPAIATEERPMTMCEKVITRHAMQSSVTHVKPGDPLLVRVDGGYSHEFTTAQVHHFLDQNFGDSYRVQMEDKLAVFEDHLIYANEVDRFQRFLPKIEDLRRMQRDFQRHTGVLSFHAEDGRSPGICHQVAREKIIEPGDFIQATDSHTCMAGGSNAYAYGVGATEYAALIQAGSTLVVVPESIRFELTGTMPANVTAKDLMLHILWRHARNGDTIDRCMEFGGPGIASLSMDERATLANMATECSARSGIVEADDKTFEWIRARRPDIDEAALRSRVVSPDPDAEYAGGTHQIDLSSLRPMVAHPGDPDHGIPSDPTNGAYIDELGTVPIDIAYGGSCTAGKRDDLDFYAVVASDAVSSGRRVAEGVRFFIQFGSSDVAQHAQEQGHVEVFEKAGITVIPPGCGACIGCGPGVSESAEQVTVSAINRNYKGRSGPGKLYLASPLTVAASAFTGTISAYRKGMFSD